jgi:hypothetical protein
MGSFAASKAGLLRSRRLPFSASARARLRAAETEHEQLQQLQTANNALAVNIERLMPDLSASFVRLVEKLEKTLTSGDVNRAREEIRSHVGAL